MSFYNSGPMDDDLFGSTNQVPNIPMAFPTADVIQPPAPSAPVAPPSSRPQFTYDNILNTPQAFGGNDVFDLTGPSPVVSNYPLPVGPTQPWSPQLLRTQVPEVRTGIQDWARPRNTQLNLGINRTYTATATRTPSRQVVPRITLGGLNIDDTNLGVPPSIPTTEATRRKLILQKQLDFTRDNPPVLPATTIPEAKARPNVPRQLEAAKRAEGLAQVGRAWNNKSAQRSRMIKKEALQNAERLFVETATQNLWLRLRLATEGVDAMVEWEATDQRVRDALDRQIGDYIRPVKEERTREYKAREKAKRINRNRERAAQDIKPLTEQELKEWSAMLATEMKTKAFSLRTGRGVRQGRVEKATAKPKQRTRINVANLVQDEEEPPNMEGLRVSEERDLFSEDGGDEQGQEQEEGGVETYGEDIPIDPELLASAETAMSFSYDQFAR